MHDIEDCILTIAYAGEGTYATVYKVRHDSFSLILLRNLYEF